MTRRSAPPSKKPPVPVAFLLVENFSEETDMNQHANPNTVHIVEDGLVTLIGTLPATASRRAALVCLKKEGK